MGVAILRAQQEAGRACGAACLALLQIQLRATYAPHPLVTHAQTAVNTSKVQPVGCYSWCCSATQVIKYLTVFTTGTGVLGSLACVGSTSSIVSWLY
ncbi:hypothetical protein FOA52_003216 [Chlamydomonas sp. UWO 241]|nr:hypothetical protein FOA52_003216 [Chlamydomonas sp. UWO 241]